MAALAGCSGGGGDGGGGEDGGGGGEDDAATATGTTGTATGTTATTTGATSDVTGSVTSEVDELEIVDWRTLPDVLPKWFVVGLTVENVGEKRTAVLDYNFEMTVYDADGNDITRNGVGSGGGDTEIGPGERTDLDVEVQVEGKPEDVARFEITLQCSGPVDSEAVYCQ